VGRLSVLLKRNKMTVLEARKILKNKGLSREMVHCILRPSVKGIDQEQSHRTRLQVPKSAHTPKTARGGNSLPGSAGH
jgi:hypothetical protein